MKTAFLFPGQGSQRVGMGKALAEAVRSARRVFEEADDVLGFELSRLCFDGPDEELRLTSNTQPAILTTSIAALKALEERGTRCEFVAGHSVGEYSALVAAGCLSFGDALTIVRSRGQFMQEAVPTGEGAMAALVGCDIEVASAICREASELGVCAASNVNSPTQIVIAGHRASVDRAVVLAKERGVRRAVMLAVSAPFHCELMRPAADRLEPLLRKTRFADLTVPLATNVDAELISTGESAREALIRQVSSPVRWSDAMKRLVEAGATRFIEVGAGKVLSGLLRQISRNCEVLNVEDPESLELTVAAVQ
jgi:[acyl-carrier-protein] S-malonyltransferase